MRIALFGLRSWCTKARAHSRGTIAKTRAVKLGGVPWHESLLLAALLLIVLGWIILRLGFALLAVH